MRARLVLALVMAAAVAPLTAQQAALNPEPAARARRLQGADRDQLLDDDRGNDRRGAGDGQAVSRCGIPRERHLPGRRAAGQVQRRPALPRAWRTGRAKAAAAPRAPRRRRGAEERLVERPRPVQVPRARRLLLRARHLGRQGDGRDLRGQHHPPEAGGIRPGARHRHRAHGGRRGRLLQRRPLARRQSPGARRRRVRDQRRRRRFPARRQAVAQRRAGDGEGVRQLHDHGAQQGRPLLGAAPGQRDLSNCRRDSSGSRSSASPCNSTK